MSNSALTQDTRKPTYTNPLIAFLVSATISRLGNLLASLAIPWFVLATTGSATNTALTVAIGTIPLIVTGVLGGTLVDRFGYWRTIVVSEIASGISTLMIPILHFTIGIEFWHVMAFAFRGPCSIHLAIQRGGACIRSWLNTLRFRWIVPTPSI